VVEKDESFERAEDDEDSLDALDAVEVTDDDEECPLKVAVRSRCCSEKS